MDKKIGALGVLFYLKSLCKEMSLGGGDRSFGGGYPRAPPPPPPLYETLLNTTPQTKFCLIEKLAKCHRHFPHGDTDTNMYLER